jgi:hypothetical protein
LNETTFTGQTLSLDIFFADSRFLAAAGGSINLFINQSGDLGTEPESFAMTGYLLDPDGNPLNVPLSDGDYGKMPAQVWPGWGFFLPDGREYLPATSFQGRLFEGAQYPDPENPGAGYYIDPVLFSGLHFDITLGENLERTVIGTRLVLANFDFPIHVSPSSKPEFYVHVPEPASIGFLALGFLGLAGLGRRLKLLKQQT